MNDYEKDALVIKKMIGVVHPDYLVNSIAEFLKERDTKQLHKPVVMQAEGSDESDGAAVGQRSVGTVAEARGKVDMIGCFDCIDKSKCNCWYVKQLRGGSAKG